MKRLLRLNVGIILAIIAMPGLAEAQIRPPTTTQPGQVQQHLQIQEERPAVSEEPLITLPEEGGKHKALKGEATFILKGIDFENVTVFKKEDFLPDYEAYLGKEVSLSTLHEIAFKITAQYRNAGYILSKAVVPPQQIGKDGIAKIRIVEGYINKVVFEGVPATGLLAKYADHIRNAKPLDAKMLERYLLLMNDLPGVTAHAVLRPATDAPGASDVIITISEKSVDGSVTLDNRGTRFMGPIQAGVTVNANNMLGLYDRTQFHGVMTAQENELRYGQVTHEEQLDSDGTKVALSAGYTRTHPTYTLDPFDVQGWDRVYSVNVSHPFIRSRQSNLYGNIQFDAHDTAVDVLTTQLYDDHLRVLRGGGSYDFIDMFSGVNKMQATLAQGLSWDTSSSDVLSRANGQTNFFKGTAQVSRLQTIKGPFDFYIAGSGQWSADSLLIGEQFGIGGVDFGSAYDPSELTGDSGAAGRAEIRYNRNGDFVLIPSYQLYTFYDIGKVWNRDTPTGSTASLADAGFGFRFNAEAPLSGALEFAAPLTKVVAADGTRDGYDPRVFFSLAYRY